jgi:hypothetical protein
MAKLPTLQICTLLLFLLVEMTKEPRKVAEYLTQSKEQILNVILLLNLSRYAKRSSPIILMFSFKKEEQTLWNLCNP